MAAIAGLWALAAPASAFAPASDELIGAASDEHFWIIIEPGTREETFALAHLPADEPSWHYRVQHTMSQAPAKMAAWSDRVWLVHQPRLIGGGSLGVSMADGPTSGPAATQPATENAPASTGSRWQREVYSCQVVKNAATGLYYTLPTGRLEMMPPLAGLGRLAGFVATRQGPVALLLPTQRASVTITAGDNSAAAEPFLDRPTLWRLEPGASSWTEIRLPDDLDASRPATLSTFGAVDHQLALLGRSRSTTDADGATLFIQRRDGTWSASSIDVDLRRVRALTSVAGQVAAVIADPGSQTSRIAYLRPGAVLPLAALDIPVAGASTAGAQPQDKWLLAGFNDRLVLIEREGRGGGRGRGAPRPGNGDAGPQLTVRTIDPLTGEISAPQPFIEQPITAWGGRMWQMIFIIGLALAAALLVAMLRPAPPAAIKVDANAVLPAGWRLMAAVVDFVVGAVPTMLLLGPGTTLGDLLTLPILSMDIARCGPYLLAAALSTIIATVGEVLSGKSIGKALVGGQVTALDGSRPPAWRIVVRGLTRFIVFALPLLAILNLTNTYLQGLPDWAGRTLVLGSNWKPTDKHESDDAASPGEPDR